MTLNHVHLGTKDLVSVLAALAKFSKFTSG